MKIEQIVWLDAVSGETDSLSFSKIKNPKQARKLLTETISVGMVSYEDKKTLLLIQNENKCGDIDYLAIPKGWIKKRRDLGRYKP